MSKWISVEDRLPEESGKYLTYNRHDKYTDVLDYSQRHKFFNAFDTIEKNEMEKFSLTVTHWMPLPELPEEVE